MNKEYKPEGKVNIIGQVKKDKRNRLLTAWPLMAMDRLSQGYDKHFRPGNVINFKLWDSWELTSNDKLWEFYIKNPYVPIGHNYVYMGPNDVQKGPPIE